MIFIYCLIKWFPARAKIAPFGSIGIWMENFLRAGESVSISPHSPKRANVMREVPLESCCSPGKFDLLGLAPNSPFGCFEDILSFPSTHLLLGLLLLAPCTVLVVHSYSSQHWTNHHCRWKGHWIITTSQYWPRRMISLRRLKVPFLLLSRSRETLLAQALVFREIPNPAATCFDLRKAKFPC